MNRDKTVQETHSKLSFEKIAAADDLRHVTVGVFNSCLRKLSLKDFIKTHAGMKLYFQTSKSYHKNKI